MRTMLDAVRGEYVWGTVSRFRDVDKLVFVNVLSMSCCDLSFGCFFLPLVSHPRVQYSI